MDRKAALVAVIATAVGIALLRLYMYRFEQEAGGGPKRSVLVLLADVAPGSVLERGALGTRELPQAYLESRHISARQLNDVLGLRLAVAVRAHEALLWTDLATMRPAARTLSSLVPPGMRALNLALRSGAFDELLTAGDRVDVLATDGGGAATTVAEDVLVLAIGAALGRAGGPSGAGRARRGDVTVSVSPEQGRALAAAEQRGSLRLVLRNPDDVGVGTSAPAAHDAPGPRTSARDERER